MTHHLFWEALMANSTDQRVMLTKKILKDALLSLMEEKSINKITPTELCRRANINRNTFYSHYRAPEDILHEMEDEILKDLTQAFEQHFHYHTIEELVRQSCTIFQENADICRIIFSVNSESDSLLRIVRMANNTAYAEWRRAGLKASDSKLEQIFQYCSGGCVSAIRNWLENNMKEDIDEMARQLDAACRAAMAAMMEK